MSQVTEEIINVTRKFQTPMTAMAIYEKGSFENIQPVYVALSTMHKGDNPAIIRHDGVNGGKYKYAFNPEYKPGVPSRSTVPAKVRQIKVLDAAPKASIATRPEPRPIPSFADKNIVIDSKPASVGVSGELERVRDKLTEERARITARSEEIDKALAAIGVVQATLDGEKQAAR